MDVIFHNVIKDFNHQLVSSVITLAVLVLIYLITTFIISRRLESRRTRNRYRVRALYVTCFLYVILMARIWFEGFNTIFAVLGLVSAALVVTNKETIMNFTGWLIIQWRSLFTEKDYIQIQNYNGYVKKIGVFYFTLWETLDNSEKNLSGRVIRIPNGLVATQPIINYSQTYHFLAFSLSYTITGESDIKTATDLTAQIIEDVLEEHYHDRPEYCRDYLLRKDAEYTRFTKMEPSVSIRPRQEKPFGVQITAQYYCFAIDHNDIEQKIWFKLLPVLQQHQTVKLAFNS